MTKSHVRLPTHDDDMPSSSSYPVYPLIEKLWREGQQQLIPIKESETKRVPRLEKNKETKLHGKDKLNAYK